MSNQSYVGVLLCIIIAIAIQEKLLAIGILASIALIAILFDVFKVIKENYRQQEESKKSWIDRYSEIRDGGSYNHKNKK